MLKIKFLIYESSYLVRQALQFVVRELHNCELLGSFISVNKMVSDIKNHQADIILINLSLIDDATMDILKNGKVEYGFELIGIEGTNEMNKLQSIFSEIIYLTDDKAQIIKKLDSIIREGRINQKIYNAGNNNISDRERAVLELVAKGDINKEIADKLFISIHTVITHRKNIVKKLGIKTVSGLTVYAILNNIIDMSDLK